MSATSLSWNKTTTVWEPKDNRIHDLSNLPHAESNIKIDKVVAAIYCLYCCDNNICYQTPVFGQTTVGML